MEPEREKTRRSRDFSGADSPVPEGDAQTSEPPRGITGNPNKPGAAWLWLFLRKNYAIKINYLLSVTQEAKRFRLY
jgi:hypothetical protein